MPTLVLVGLLAGIVTSLSPCVLPVLPVVLTAGSRRPWAVVGGLVTSFSLATLFGALVLRALHLPDGLLRNAGIAALVLLGLGLVFPKAGHLLERPFARLRGRLTEPGRGGYLTGLALGLVYVPCAGPVLATIAVVGATNMIGLDSLLLTAAFGVGTGLPLLLLAFSGAALTNRLVFLRERVRGFRVASGVAMLLVAVVTAANLAAPLQRLVPDYTAAAQRAFGGQQQLAGITHAPEFTGVSAWLNTPGGRPLSLAELRGRVVLVNFWTYSCVNCQRALPHVRQWYDTYRDSGLTVVGVHTPEFAFERDQGNVADQVRALGVRHPVAVDNDYATWTAYQNRYWPALYAVDASGQVRQSWFGEGDYDQVEQRLRELLADAGARNLPPATSVPDRTPQDRITGETYLGSEHGPLSRAVTLSGTWSATPEHLTAGQDARLRLDFRAKAVHLVLGGTGTVEVVVGGTRRAVAVSGPPTLYTLHENGSTGGGVLELAVGPGLRAYAFTFS